MNCKWRFYWLLVWILFEWEKGQVDGCHGSHHSTLNTIMTPYFISASHIVSFIMFNVQCFLFALPFFLFVSFHSVVKYCFSEQSLQFFLVKWQSELFTLSKRKEHLRNERSYVTLNIWKPLFQFLWQMRSEPLLPLDTS